jgi:hypothetical protein
VQLLKTISIFSFLFLGINFSVYGQDPYYFVLGEKELGNADVYSILQTRNELLYVATNNGLYEYKHGKMNLLLNAKEQKGSSLFTLIENNKNDVLCHNLSGQIFKVNNSKLELYFELPKKYLGPRVNMAFDKNDNLIIVSNGCILISNGEVQEVYYNQKNQANFLYSLPDKKIMLVTKKRTDSTLFIENKKVKHIKLASTINKDFYDKQTLILNDKFIKRNTKTGDFVIINNNKKFNLIKTDWADEFIQFSNQEIWVRSGISGVNVIVMKNDSIKLKESFFKDIFISKIAKGRNGVLFFGTFGRGLIMVPKQNVKKHEVGQLGSKLRGIATDKNNNIFLSDRKEGILHYKKTAKRISDSTKYFSEKIFCSPFENNSLNKEFPSLLNIKLPIGGAAKDVCFVDSTTTLFATSVGLFKMGKKPLVKDLKWKSNKILDHFFDLTGINERCRSVIYNQKDSIIYLATMSKLLQIDDENLNKEFKFKGNSIFANDLLFFDNMLWCATQNQGILVFKNGKLMNQFNDQNGLGSNTVLKFEKRNNQLFISHKTGFQIFNLNTSKWKTIGTAEGIINGAIKDFSVTEDKVWFISNNQLLSLQIDKFSNSKPTIKMDIDSVVVSNTIIDWKKNSTFKYDQNLFQFYTNFKGIQYENEAIIAYRIKGFEKKWNKTSSTTSVIEYKYLPSGTYKFEIEARYRDYKTKTITYSFKIKKAYWQTGWFYTLIGLSIIAFVIFLLRNSRRKNKQALEKQTLKADLISTELKALRSQMNPHFIFNSLNSIQDLILQEDTDASYDYFVLFSNLVRNILNYSNQQFIPIDKELEFLETYLKLESLRFGEDFHYKIESCKKIDFKIPSLIIQPFVENALVHGLFHKEGSKNLQIIFECTDEIKCTIIDNGIGREKAKEIYKRQGKIHQSFALESIKKRLHILAEQYDENIGYTITDLYNGSSPCGTKIVITLPFIN